MVGDDFVPRAWFREAAAPAGPRGRLAPSRGGRGNGFGSGSSALATRSHLVPPPRKSAGVASAQGADPLGERRLRAATQRCQSESSGQQTTTASPERPASAERTRCPKLHDTRPEKLFPAIPASSEVLQEFPYTLSNGCRQVAHGAEHRPMFDQDWPFWATCWGSWATSNQFRSNLTELVEVLADWEQHLQRLDQILPDVSQIRPKSIRHRLTRLIWAT